MDMDNFRSRGAVNSGSGGGDRLEVPVSGTQWFDDKANIRIVKYWNPGTGRIAWCDRFYTSMSYSPIPLTEDRIAEMGFVGGDGYWFSPGKNFYLWQIQQNMYRLTVHGVRLRSVEYVHQVQLACLFLGEPIARLYRTPIYVNKS